MKVLLLYIVVIVIKVLKGRLKGDLIKYLLNV